MISLNDLAVAYGARTLFSGVNVLLTAGGRYGIVGANGAGKSTLLRVLAGTEEASSGTVAIPKSARVGFLEQDHFKYEDVPILDVVMMGVPELWDAMSEKAIMLEAAQADPDAFDVERYGVLEEVVLAHDGYTLEARAAEILEGLNIPAAKHREPLSVLSGGYKLRVLLAKVLAGSPEVLLLDEPTNHLDIVSIAWLEQFLQTFPGCAVIVSHDHHFLNAVCTHILDVDYEEVRLYPGDYDAFEIAKVSDRERKEGEIAKQEATIAQHQDFVRRFRAKATKARQAQSKLKQIEKIDVEILPQSSRQYPTFKLGARRQTGKMVVAARGVRKAFGDNEVLSGVSFEVRQGERVAVIGANGIGKSTLLKIMVGALEADAGEVEWGHEAEPGYFSQDQSDVRSHGGSTILDWLWTHCPDKPVGFVRGKLAEVLFGKEDVSKKISALSGGEVARLALCELGIRQPTVLVLDEPTNHLDLEGIESLAEGLEGYPNAIVFVSHDRWFVERLATRVIEISERGVEDYRGSYSDFLRWSAGDDEPSQAQTPAPKKSNDGRRPEPEPAPRPAPAIEQAPAVEANPGFKIRKRKKK